MRRRLQAVALDAVALAALAAATLLIFWALVGTNLVLAGVDAFTYFTPYRDYANAALRQGRLPLWNPYLFLGVPFLANIQAAVLYPLNWLFVTLWAPKALVWSAVLHIWLAAAFTYGYARRGIGLSRSAAWVAAAAFAFSGFLGGQVEHVNQLSAGAWFPLLLLLFYEAVHGRANGAEGSEGEGKWKGEIRNPKSEIRISKLLLLGLVVALQLLAGHTQAAYINLFGLGVYGFWPLFEAGWRVWQQEGLRGKRKMERGKWKGEDGEAREGERQGHSPEPCPELHRMAVEGTEKGGQGWLCCPFSIFRLPFSWKVGEAGRRAVAYGAAVALGLALAAAQLLPTLELSRLSVRAGGLSFREAISFSLRPRMLLYTLLPTYGEDLGQAFGTEGFSEYVAYIGVLGLVLAAWGAWRGHPSWARRRFLVLAACGFVLALGIYNPAYFLLYKLVPGFDLFRAPARWMFLYTFGAAMLAGLGAEQLRITHHGSRITHHASRFTFHVSRFTHRSRVFLVAAAIVGLALLVWLRKPGWVTWAAWGGTAAVAAAFLAFGRRSGAFRRALPLVLPLALLIELTAASRALPHACPTAPEAIRSLRTAPAHLLSDRSLYRFLSLSDITYDPGDLAEIEQLFGDQLPPEAVYDFVVATKEKEILAPNLPLLYRIPAVDGYDGGVLPLARYVTLQRLFLDEADLSPDGRLREQLKAIPPARLLNLLNVKYVITDKLFDVWLDDVYYDLQHRAVLGADGVAEVTLEEMPACSATALGVISHLRGAEALPDGTAVAEIVLGDAAGRVERLLLRAGEHTSEGAYEAGAVAHAQARVARPWPEHVPGQDYLAVLEFAAPLRPQRLTVRALLPAGQFVLRGLSLIDQRTGAHWALTVSSEGRFARVHSGDVKVYENLDLLPRAYVVHAARVLPDDEAALAALADPSFDPAREVILMEGGGGKGEDGKGKEEKGKGERERRPFSIFPFSSEGGEEVAVVQVYEPERVVVQVTLAEPGYLVLSDTHYPGWKAWVDGGAAPILRANLLFRAVALEAGEHTVEFRYQPASLRWGAVISLAALVALMAGLGYATLRRAS